MIIAFTLILSCICFQYTERGSICQASDGHILPLVDRSGVCYTVLAITCKKERLCEEMKKMSMYWPVALIVIANVVYNICSKQTPGNIHPLASLTVTYIVGALVCFVLYFVLNRGGNIVQEWQKINWTTLVLGIAIIGMEAGSIYLYKAGWAVNAGQLVCSACIAVALIFVGYLLYKEQISWNKMAGIAVIMAGMLLINLK